MAVRGRVQTADNVTHILVEEVIDRTNDLEYLTEDAQYMDAKEDKVAQWPMNTRNSASAQHPRNVRIIPKSRDFH